MPGPEDDQKPCPDMDAMGDPREWPDAEEGLAAAPGLEALAELVKTSERISSLPRGPTGQAVALARAAAEILQEADPAKRHYDAVVDMGQELLAASKQRLREGRNALHRPLRPAGVAQAREMGVRIRLYDLVDQDELEKLSMAVRLAREGGVEEETEAVLLDVVARIAHARQVELMMDRRGGSVGEEEYERLTMGGFE